jgi:hypothetical protein
MKLPLYFTTSNYSKLGIIYKVEQIYLNKDQVNINWEFGGMEKTKMAYIEDVEAYIQEGSYTVIEPRHMDIILL